jgi:histone acetyltransferase (RNA polymerase elongator complex component)
MKSKYYIIPIFVPNKGCPHNCIFCDQKRITGEEKDITKADVENTIDEYLSTIDREDSTVELSFFGGSFTGIPISYQNELLDAAKNALNHGRIDAIRLSTRPDYINKFILDNLKAHDVGIIELGVQSMDGEVLKYSERGHSADDVINATKLIREYGFTLGHQMMIGLPKDNEEKDIETAKKIIGLKPDLVRIYPALVIKGTKMEDLFNEGLYKPLDVDEAVNISAKLYKMFIKNDIKVIRIGLQTTDQINVGRDVVGGPFHPAFGELVESKVLNEMVQFLFNSYFKDSTEVEINVSPKVISKLYAAGKKYFCETLNAFSTKKITVRQNISLNGMTLELISGETNKKMSIYEFIKLSK